MGGENEEVYTRDGDLLQVAGGDFSTLLVMDVTLSQNAEDIPRFKPLVETRESLCCSEVSGRKAGRATGTRTLETDPNLCHYRSLVLASVAYHTIRY